MLGSAHIVIVDDDPRSASGLADALERRCRATTRIVRTLDAALVALRRHPCDLVVTELRLPDGVGPTVVRRLVAGGACLVIVVTAHGSEEIAAEATRLGAARYVPKRAGFAAEAAMAVDEVLGERLLARIEPDPLAGVAEAAALRPALPLVVASAEMQHVIALAARAARSNATVLLEGETGTGKELVARAIHAYGPRASAPFRVQNCAALPETLLEAELFGHVRGAFTSAERDRPGLFLDARDGTVFLDEVGDAPPGLQAKLLRVLQEGEVKPIGADRPQRSRARVIAATHRRLDHAVATGRFRSDLYYRLSVFPITVPPLRDRPEDILPLARHFLARFEHDEGRPLGPLTDRARAALVAYRWPGNVRELEHEMHRLVLTLSPAVPIDVHALAPRIRAAGAGPGGAPLDSILRRVELAVLRDRIRRAPSKAAAARSLGITREALYWKLRRLEATDPDAG